jgi:C-terminal peptidase prc
MWHVTRWSVIGRRLLAVVAVVVCATAAFAAPAPLVDGTDSWLVVAALRALERHYVDPVDPVALLNAAIVALRRESRQGARVLPSIPPGVPEARAVFLFQEAFARGAAAGRVPIRTLAYAAIRRMLATLHDNHVFYLEPAPFSEAAQRLAGQPGYEGVGILATHARTPNGEGEIFIREIVPGSPAALAGLRRFDRITAVDGLPVSQIPVRTATDLIRGPSGSLVDLNILRGTQKLTAILRRGPITVSPVKAQWLRPGIVYVRVIEFSEGTAVQLRKAIQTLRSNGPIHAVILDLRWNRGGFVEEAERVAGIFLPTGTIVGHLVRRGESLKILRAAGTPLLLWPHIVVLTNAETASSSEVVASGLLGAHRATVLGGDAGHRVPRHRRPIRTS